MSNSSERELQQALHQAGFYTQRSPSSGLGIKDPETGIHIDQADIVAIRHLKINIPVSGVQPIDTSLVLIFEDKHVEPPRCTIKQHEKEELERMRDITGGQVWIAVKWKRKHGGHQFFTLDDLIDTGKHWKITEETSGKVLDDVLP